MTLGGPRGTPTPAPREPLLRVGLRARRGEKPPSQDVTDQEITRSLRKAMKDSKPGSVQNWQAWQRELQPGVRSLNEDLLSLLTEEQLATLGEWVNASLSPVQPLVDGEGG